ncbi:hypothetical protein [Emergencia sp. 1XD21-10]|uniref:hypothetical protein n=1 Tax=Emergencia sp. 1XD21-10 TaxID=2304569 RepID=UPI001379E7CD|nr:hypothetical protein [Emergencia sp. 1XD21-10]NCF00145.1 hypothetical protein [Emergencia sp. 1XD21-10]
MKKVKHKTLSASFIVATISILLVQILFFSVLYFYGNEYVLPEPQLRRISYAEWNWYVAQPSTNIYDSTLLQICAFRPYLTLTMWIFNAFHIKACKIGLCIKVLLFLISILALIIPALLMNFYVTHCILPMTLIPLEMLSLLLSVILIVNARVSPAL